MLELTGILTQECSALCLRWVLLKFRDTRSWQGTGNAGVPWAACTPPIFPACPNITPAIAGLYKQKNYKTEEQTFYTGRTNQERKFLNEELISHSNHLILTSLCPDIVFSNLPSYAPQILMSLSAAGKECASSEVNYQHCQSCPSQVKGNQLTLALGSSPSPGRPQGRRWCGIGEEQLPTQHSAAAEVT